MEVNDQNLGFLQSLLQSGLAADNATRKAAEAALQQHESSAGFALLVLSLISRLMASSGPAEATIRLSAAVLFKNVVKRRWQPEDDELPSIATQEKEVIKQNLVEMMTSAPQDVQKQLAEAVSIVAQHDFPTHWQGLLPQLVAMLAKQDVLVTRGVLLTANSITKRFRNVAKSDELFLVILECLQHLAAPLLAQFQRNGELITQYASSIRELTVLMESQRLIARIFFSLNWQDIPEVFEDNAHAWMTEFAKYLTYTNAILVDNDEEHESGPVEKLQAAVLENISLYASKYEEVFEPFLPQFTQLVWKLLMDVDAKPKHDLLATSAIRFLTSVASKAHNVKLFTEPVLRDIVEHIVVKNVTATESDEELFEDNPTEFVRKDMEGSDSDSRRRCAIDLVRALLRFFAGPVSQLCLGYTHTLLTQYAQTRDWRCKDAALHLLLAVGVFSGTMTSGAGEINPAVDVLSLLTQHVFPEIQEAPTSSLSVEKAFVKADAIKLICFFRAHLSLPSQLSLLPRIVHFLHAPQVVLQTYAAICVEKLLVLKDRDAATNTSKTRIGRDELRPVFPALMHGLFTALENPSFAENEYVMKCIMRSLATAAEDVSSALELVLAHLIKALEKVCKNPVNPHYNHYLFECLALSVKAACGTGTGAVTEAQLAACARFETLLFPLFQMVLAQDIAEFVPYVFQILAQLLNARPKNSGLTDAYRALFVPLLSPALWERKGNVPALVDLYKAYLSRGMKEIVAGNNLTGVLGVFQKLLSSKSTEASAFQLLHTIYAFSSLTDLRPFIPTIFNLLLHRLQDSVKISKRVPYAKHLCHSLCVFAILFGAPTLHETLETLTPGLPAMLVMNIWGENRVDYWALGEAEVKQTLVGGTKLLCESPLSTNAEAAKSLYQSLQALAAQAPSRRPELSMADEEVAEDRAFDSSYSKLSFAYVPSVDPAAEIANGAEYFTAQTAAFGRA